MLLIQIPQYSFLLRPLSFQVEFDLVRTYNKTFLRMLRLFNIELLQFLDQKEGRFVVFVRRDAFILLLLLLLKH